MEIPFEEILENKNIPIIDEKYQQQNHLILSKYTSKMYYKYSLELLQTLIEKSGYPNKKYIFHMSLLYLLKILYNFKNTPYIDNYDLLVFSSFSLGIKVSVDQYKSPLTTKIKHIYSEKYSSYTNEEIQKCEIICLKLLDYNINILSPYECLYFLFSKDIFKFSLLINELENILFNDLDEILFKKPYELAQDTINRLNIKNINLLIPKNAAPLPKKNNKNINKKILNNESTPTTSVSSYGSNNTRNNFSLKKIKGLRSQSNAVINNDSIINNINKELTDTYKNNNCIIIRGNNSANKNQQDNKNYYPIYISINKVKKNKNDEKKVIYKNISYKKKDSKNKKEQFNNIKILNNSNYYNSVSGNTNLDFSSNNKSLVSRNEITNFKKIQVNKFLCFSNKKSPIKNENKNEIKETNSKFSINENYSASSKYCLINKEKIINNFSSNNIKVTRMQNVSENTIFKKPTIDKKKMKTKFKSNKKNKNYNKQQINFNTALKNCNIQYEKISDLCKKINFDVFNCISDKDKLHN